jgi:signal transduction histidine kinase
MGGMKGPDFAALDLNVARARIALSVVALVSIYIDPTTAEGIFSIDRAVLATLALHFAYGLTAYSLIRRRVSPEQVFAMTTALDILFATAITFFTEGPTSPSYVFFTFAIIAVGCRAGLRSTLWVTLVSVGLYLFLIAASSQGVQSLYMMRPAYLAITGCVIGFLGQQRAIFEVRVRELETLAEREEIARALHDGYVQVLAGLNLRFEGLRELIIRGRTEKALEEMRELQIGITREYDEVRAYIHSLVNLDRKIAEAGTPANDAHFRVETSFSANAVLVEQILLIMLEGVRNARRHAQAREVSVKANEAGELVRITIDDDGVGFKQAEPPWAIASRVAEFGGQLRLVGQNRSGAHMEIELRAA